MTTYSYELTLRDGEAIMLEAALELMIEHCEKQLAADEGAPYFAYKLHAQDVLSRLYSNMHKTSGNNFSK